MQSYEILGHFYLGKTLNPQTMEKTDQYFLYDSKDLTTHAICIGMTGSGKTGLGINILEEAAIDNIPALIIDPKGDMGNLLLTFPELSPEDFLPWLQASDAERNGISLEEYAKQKASDWKNGLKEWNQDSNRIRTLKNKADFSIYTPGGATNPLSIVQILDCPTQVLNDSEMLNDYAVSSVSALLSLIGIKAEPLQSKEHILLTNILLDTWQQKQNMDLAKLIKSIIKPEIEKIGVLSLEEFFPESERMTLATAFNNLLAAPQFAVWLEGEPINIQNLLYTPEGKPRMSVISLNHLNDQEKMFFISLFLNQVLAWLRTQSGTSSLRAILYMDEIFGFVPPVANPPSKKPMLSLLKQARAFGLGVVLATQNPVDIDYKGLANIGTWFVGRLQTEQDKNKLLDGLQIASKTNQASSLNFDRKDLSALISSLPPRSFISNNIHDAGPTLFETRWCLSYLAGPLSRNQISSLQEKNSVEQIDTAPSEKLTDDENLILEQNDNEIIERSINSGMTLDLPPNVPKDIRQYYLTGTSNQYIPTLFAHVETSYESSNPVFSKSVISNWQTQIKDEIIAVDWKDAQLNDFDLNNLETKPSSDGKYLNLPDIATRKSSYTNWQKELVDHIYRNETFVLYANQDKTVVAQPDESQAEFMIRLRQANREQRDEEIETLRKKYDKKFASLVEKIRKAEQAVEREKDQADQAKFSTFINLGSTILDTLVGRRKGVGKTTINKAARSLRSAGRSRQQSGDVVRAKESLETYQKDFENLEMELEQEINTLTQAYAEKEDAYQEITIKPKKKDILVKVFALLWQA
ncbi:MAG: DUF87 domain-containing protein [Clostridiaceae bacterium]|nr:DUF87 domain-containing protein [Clostridiaceae bacterium]